MALLSVESLTAGYGDTTVLSDVAINVEPGQVVSIIGPNGAGKSTLMKTVFGLLRPSSGRVVYGDREITGWSPDRIVRLGLCYVPQVENTFPSLTVEENLEMGAFTLRGNLRERLDRVFTMFPDLAASRHKAAGKLSGGQQHMLALGLALMLSPRLVMLDEPTAGLSPKFAMSALQHVETLRSQGVAVLLVEQNAAAALQLSDWAYVLASGQNRFEDTGRALLDNPEVGSLYLGK
ncbi:MAG: ABC transporter ATP-binding protein [Deinococcales bacterium]|jgi:ABC-type branched-subunit amino acid transport system ATPase component